MSADSHRYNRERYGRDDVFNKADAPPIVPQYDTMEFSERLQEMIQRTKEDLEN